MNVLDIIKEHPDFVKNNDWHQTLTNMNITKLKNNTKPLFKCELWEKVSFRTMGEKNREFVSLDMSLLYKHRLEDCIIFKLREDWVKPIYFDWLNDFYICDIITLTQIKVPMIILKEEKPYYADLMKKLLLKIIISADIDQYPYPFQKICTTGWAEKKDNYQFVDDCIYRLNPNHPLVKKVLSLKVSDFARGDQ